MGWQNQRFCPVDVPRARVKDDISPGGTGRPDHIPDPRGRPVIIGVKNHIDINRPTGRHSQGVSVIIEIDPIGTLRRPRGGFYDCLVVGEVYAPVARDLDGHLDAGADCVDRDLFTGLRGPAVYSCGLVGPAPGAPAGSDRAQRRPR